LLKFERYLLIRIPVTSSYAWKHYGVNWMQLDPPRHLYLYSPKSLEILASKAGFIVEDIVFDSSEYQFIGSELYQRDIPLMAGWNQEIYSKAEVENFRLQAQKLNSTGEGDQACFYLYKGAA